MVRAGRVVLVLLWAAGCGSSDEDERQARQLVEQGYGVEQQTFGRASFASTRSVGEDQGYREALALYKQSVQLAPGLQTPDRGTNLEAVGRMHLLLGEYDQAASWFEQASEANVATEYACPYFALGSVYRRLGNPELPTSSSSPTPSGSRPTPTPSAASRTAGRPAPSAPPRRPAPSPSSAASR